MRYVNIFIVDSEKILRELRCHCCHRLSCQLNPYTLLARTRQHVLWLQDGKIIAQTHSSGRPDDPESDLESSNLLHAIDTLPVRDLRGTN